MTKGDIFFYYTTVSKWIAHTHTHHLRLISHPLSLFPFFLLDWLDDVELVNEVKVQYVCPIFLIIILLLFADLVVYQVSFNPHHPTRPTFLSHIFSHFSKLDVLLCCMMVVHLNHLQIVYGN